MGLDVDMLCVAARQPHDAWLRRADELLVARRKLKLTDDRSGLAGQAIHGLHPPVPGAPSVWIGYGKNVNYVAIADDLASTYQSAAAAPLFVSECEECVFAKAGDAQLGGDGSLVSPSPGGRLDRDEMPEDYAADWLVGVAWYLPRTRKADAAVAERLAADSPAESMLRAISGRDERTVCDVVSGPVGVCSWADSIHRYLAESGTETGFTVIVGTAREAYLLQLGGDLPPGTMTSASLHWTPGECGPMPDDHPLPPPAPVVRKLSSVEVTAMIQALDPGPVHRSARPEWQKQCHAKLRGVIAELGLRETRPGEHLSSALTQWLKALYRQYFDERCRDLIIERAHAGLVHGVNGRIGGAELLAALSEQPRSPMADAAAVSLGLDEDDQNAAERVAAHLRQCGWSAEALPELVRRHDLGVVHVTDIEPEEFILVSTAPAAVTHRRMRRYYRLPLEGRMNVMTSVLTAAEVEGVLGALDPHAPIVRAFELVGTHLREEADYGPSVFVAHTLDVKRAPIGEDAFDRLLDVHTYAVERFPYADALSSIVPVEVTLDDGRTMVGRMVTLMVPGVGGFVITSVPFGDRLLLRWIDREALPETIDLTALERALGRGLADLDLEGVNAFFGGRETPQPAAGRDLAAQRRLAALGLVALFQMIAAESADPTAAELAFRLGLAGATDPVLRMLIDEIERDPSAVDDLVDEAARRRASLSLLGMIEASPCPLDVKRAVVDVFGFATAQQVAILHTFLGVD